MTHHSGHIVLLGDSIFDNRAYTRGEPDVVEHLRAILPKDWTATLCAVDGATTRDLPRQVAAVPRDGSHLMVSIGGNDALQNSDLLSSSSTSTAHTLRLFAERLERFEGAYRRAIGAVRALRRHITVCTVYNGNLDVSQARIATVALTTFNDAILRVAFELKLDVVELRLVCTEAADYANPIEPSGRGGKKIAQAIAKAAGALGGEAGTTRVFTF